MVGRITGLDEPEAPVGLGFAEFVIGHVTETVSQEIPKPVLGIGHVCFSAWGLFARGEVVALHRVGKRNGDAVLSVGEPRFVAQHRVVGRGLELLIDVAFEGVVESERCGGKPPERNERNHRDEAVEGQASNCARITERDGLLGVRAILLLEETEQAARSGFRVHADIGREFADSIAIALVVKF